METVGVTMLRQIRKIATTYVDVYGKHADPEVTKLVDYLNDRIPPVCIEQEIRLVARLHKLTDPDRRVNLVPATLER